MCYEIVCYEIVCYESVCYEIVCYEIVCYEIACYETITRWPPRRLRDGYATVTRRDVHSQARLYAHVAPVGGLVLKTVLLVPDVVPTDLNETHGFNPEPEGFPSREVRRTASP